MKRSKSSKEWLREHFQDNYVKLAQKEGYRSRAVYKLIEIQEKLRLIKPNMTLVELGAAPGGWSQVLVDWVQPKGCIVACDLLTIKPISGVTVVEGDFTEEVIEQEILKFIGHGIVDGVLSDMAPNMSGISTVDQLKTMHLIESAYNFILSNLKTGGFFITKAFQGEGFELFLKQLRASFKKVVIIKPKASRPRSAEVYLVATGKLPIHREGGESEPRSLHQVNE